MIANGSTNIYFVPVIQIPTFDMAEYRKRLDTYITLPNVRDKIFIGKFYSKDLFNDYGTYRENDKYYIGSSFIIKTIRGDLTTLVKRSFTASQASVASVASVASTIKLKKQKNVRIGIGLKSSLFYNRSLVGRLTECKCVNDPCVFGCDAQVLGFV